MKKILSILMILVFAVSSMTLCFAAENTSNDFVITMQIGNLVMTVNGAEKLIDAEGSAPVIVNDRTLLPVRAVVEEMGGMVAWDDNTQTVTLNYNNDKIKLVIDSLTAELNGTANTLDVAPTIINDRTMLPIRFIAESFKFVVGWDEATQTVTVRKPYTTTEYIGTNEFDFEKRTVMLNDGNEMPIIGIGTFTLTQEQAENSVYHALMDGYRLIDTAAAYNNEEGVGRGIARSNVPRDEIFVTTKLWPSNYNMQGIDACLERLGLEYVDLMLLHQPMGDYIGGYKAMEQAVKEGKIKSIGVSNFNQEQFKEILEIAEIPPVINQVETHIYNQQHSMIDYLDQSGAVIEAWFPFGGRGHTGEHFADSVIVEIAEAHKKTSAQVILRWHLQSGHIAIPGSNNPDHILENISIFDFELTDEEMAKINALDKSEPYWRGFGSQQEENDAADRWGLDIRPENSEITE